MLHTMTMPARSPLDLSLYLVTDTAQCQRAGRSVLHTVQQAVAGGVTTVQVREKTATARDFLELVLALAHQLPAHVTLLVNDRVDVYLAARAQGARVHGVHVGQSEFPVPVVRQLVGEQAIVGLTADSDSELVMANQYAAWLDYVGIGPLHATASKADAYAPLGHEAWARLRQQTHLPAVAIGGITVADVPRLRQSGADGVAVIGAICAATDAQQAARELASAWHSA